MAKCWVDGKKYDISDFGTDFSNKALWSEFVTELEEENTLLDGLNGLIQSGIVIAKHNDVVAEKSVDEISDMIADNLDSINFIKFNLGD